MRNIIALFVLASLLLSGCGTFEIYVETTPSGDSALPAGAAVLTAEPRLSLNSSSDEIRLAMLESSKNWKSVWMDGTITYNAMPQTDSQTTVLREQVWIDLTTSRFRVLTGPSDGEAEQFINSDGISIIHMDLKSGESQMSQMPEFARVGQFVPTVQPGMAQPQPLWGQIGTALSQLPFSSDLAQNEGVFKPVAMETIAGREALGVEWTETGYELPAFRIWLDTEKGIMLKLQSFGKDSRDVIYSETGINEVSFDDVFADKLFKSPSILPKFSDIAGNPLAASDPVPTASSDPDPLKDVYFFTSDHNYGNENIQFVRVPGSCVAGLTACPEAGVINPPFDWTVSLSSLVWSPNGNEAALAYPIRGEGEMTSLLVFDPQTQLWNNVMEFNYIDPPIWSPDGQWLAFRVQDGQGLDEVYAVRRDGSGLMNLSASEKLPADGSPYVLNGWINNNVILRGRNDMVYLLRVDDGVVKPLFETPWAKSNFVPSPDGYFLAYMDVNDERAVLKLLTPNGNTTRDLATFEKSSLYPIVWSPDGTQVAFAKLTQDPGMGQDVYMIASDGTNLRQVYHSNSSTITDIIFSPDGRYLLLQDDDATGRHLYVVDINTMEKHLVQIPNIPLDWWWLSPSWQR
jgi:WD40 repeat protein